MKNLDEIAKGYNDLHNEWKTLENMVRNNEFNKFLAHVKSTKNVLEIGLGDDYPELCGDIYVVAKLG